MEWYEKTNVFTLNIISGWNRCIQSGWILSLILLSFLTQHYNSFVTCEYNFGYETEDYLSAIINLTYVDPVTGLLVQEQLEMGKMLPGKTEEVSGTVVHVTSNNHTSHYACDKLDKDNLPKEHFIALIKYGGACRDQLKLKHAADEDASAAVLYTDHTPRFIKNERKAYRIAFVLINERKGEKIASLVDNGTRVIMRIGVGPRGIFRFGQINRTSVLFVSLSFIILMIISFAWLIFYYIQRFRYIHAKEMLSRKLCSAAKKALDKIPIKTVKTDESEQEDDCECCAICIESFQQGELIRSLPCKHSFHKICIDPWLLEHRSCPMCKLDILLHFGLIDNYFLQYSGSQESVLEIDDEDDYRTTRLSLTEHEIVLVQNQRRHSSVRVAIPRREDRTTSPCSLSSLNPNSLVAEQSFITSTVDESDIAVNTIDIPSEIENESSDEKLMPTFSKKLASENKSISLESVECTQPIIQTEDTNFEVCDLSFEN